jgi:aspartyl-tRNA(Asn)/glutamyl-tRNA(Gln) amidotransferase subunit B
VSGSAAQEIFAEMWKEGGDPEAIMNTRGLAQVSDEAAIAAAVDEAIKANPGAVAAYKAGKTIALGALVGAVMGKLGRKANAAVVNRILTERLA